MRDWNKLGIAPADILLPGEGVDSAAFAVVACDQFTSEPEYWDKVESLVQDKPSALRLILPEIYLEDAKSRVPGIHEKMVEYLQNGTLVSSVRDGFVLTCRQTESGLRLGLVAKLDLEAYSYEKGAKSLVRATEGTILSRIPPRMAVRKNAPLELPHVLVLIDDHEKTVIERLYEKRETLNRLYDFDLMLGGGHISGFAVTDEKDIAGIYDALDALKKKTPFLFAVGDGNHSLATAKAVWDEQKASLSESERETHPKRYALVEVENIHAEALAFEPIHRLVLNADTLVSKMLEPSPGKHAFQVITQAGERTLCVPNDNAALPVGTLQNFLDGFLEKHEGAQIDYIHGEASLRALAKKPDAIGFLVPTLAKDALFHAVNAEGALPRKTFSMGEAHEKRYYLEARRI